MLRNVRIAIENARDTSSNNEAIAGRINPD
jgi:hypothetical protein